MAPVNEEFEGSFAPVGVAPGFIAEAKDGEMEGYECGGASWMALAS